jgi:ABC-2 type transport system permease protein
VTGYAWRQYRLERKMFWRNPTAAFFNFLLPLILLALFGAVFADDQENLDVIVPGIAGMSIVATTFSAFAHNFVALREQGILKRIRGTPLTSRSYLAGLFGSAVTNTLLQVAIVIVAGKVFFGVDWPKEWPALVAFVALGVVCFGSLGIALAHAIPNVESAPAYVNAVFLPLIIISGVFYDDANAPAVLRELARALPLTHLVDGLSGAMVTGAGLADNAGALAVLAAWSAVGVVLAFRGFSWESRQA